MLLALIIILVLIGAAVIGSIYSNFLVFYSNFAESENYHKAYYASISALERGELVTKQRSPGYVGSGGFVMGTGQGTFSNGGSDSKLSGFSYLGDNADVSSVFWTVNSRANRIPSEGNGDVEWMLSADDSSEYNMMGYENSEVFLLYYDMGDNNPYNPGTISRSSPSLISGEVRLPKLLQLSGEFGFLDTSFPLVGVKNSNLPNDDAIVDWQIRGTTNNGNPFTVYSTQTTSEQRVSYLMDSIFRESDINGELGFNFSSNSWDPISSTNTISPQHGNSVPVTVISQDAAQVSGYTDHFKEVFGLSGVSLRFSLLNLLKTVDSGHVYPFLEYYADFGANVSDKYYTINGEGNFKDFQVNTIIRKPTVKETVLGNFTSIF